MRRQRGRERVKGEERGRKHVREKEKLQVRVYDCVSERMRDREKEIGERERVKEYGRQ